MESKAKAEWKGSLKEGKGIVSSDSGSLSSVPYTFANRFEGAKGTTPEELIAAAHAGCFSMALSGELGKAGLEFQSIDTSCVVTLSKVGEGFSVTESSLTTSVNAKGADKEKIEIAAASAKENCPISKLLNAEISLSLSVNS